MSNRVTETVVEYGALARGGSLRWAVRYRLDKCDTLLPRLISGELGINDAEQFIGRDV